MDKTQFGIIGLGKMGGNLALQALEKGFSIIGYDKYTIKDELIQAGVVPVGKVIGFKELLSQPRVIFLYVPAGVIEESLLDELSDVLEAGDIIVDGGNSYWGDSVRRAIKLKSKGIYFIDCGTSGGVKGAREGACFMVGGEPEAVEKVEPVFKTLSVSEGYAYAGPSGAGHFTKLVHNGIEFGMLQAIGEGMSLLENFPAKLNIEETLHCWNHGSVIRSWLIELMSEMYKKNHGFENIPSYVEDTGEVNWLVKDAINMEVPIPIISQAVMQLFISRDKIMTWAKSIAMMRHAFGGHPYGENAAIRDERKNGEVGSGKV